MIKYDPKSWLSLIFHAYSRRIIRLMLPNMIYFALFTAAVAYFQHTFFPDGWRISIEIHSLLGIVLGLFLVFRTNTAYDRWWEGRKHWGALVNNCRNLAIKVEAYLKPDDRENKAFFARHIANYPFALKEHLREGVKEDEMDGLVEDLNSPLSNYEHVPNQIAGLLYKRITALRNANELSHEQVFLLDKELKALTDILGACERIRNTPIPYSYSMYMKKFIFLYITTLPFGVVGIFGYAAIPLVVLVFYILVSTELIAEEIEDPFGLDANDLPTEELSVKIRSNVREILNQEV